MKIEIKIEADKDSMEKIQKQFSTISAGIGTVVKFFEQFEVNLKSKKDNTSTPLETEIVDAIKDETIDARTEEIVPEKEVNSDDGTEATPSIIASSTDIETPVGEEAVKSLDEDAEQAVTPSSPEKKSVPAKPAAKKSPTKKTKQAQTAPASKKAKAKKKKSVGKKPRVTAGMTVLKHLQKSDAGLDSKTLEKKTGFSAKKVADTVYKLKKDGLIQKTAQGMFVTI